MQIPNVVTPFNFSNNRYFFSNGRVRVKVDYDELTFELFLPGNRTFKRRFSFLDNPPDWFDLSDPGLLGWVRKAVNWKQHDKEEMGIEVHQIELYDKVYSVEHDTSNGELIFGIPGGTIVAKRHGFFHRYPELYVMEFGKLREKMLETIGPDRMFVLNWKKEVVSVEFDPKVLDVEGHQFRFDHDEDSGLIYLEIPDRMVTAHIDTFDIIHQDIALMLHGELRDAIKKRLKIK